MILNSSFIKKRREKLGLTQEELANIIGVSLRTILNYEGGKTIPKSKHAILQEVLEVDNETDSSAISVASKLLSMRKAIIRESLKGFPSSNKNDSIKETDAVWVDYSSFMNIPVVQKRAQAGFLSGWGDDEYLEELPTIPWEVDREYKGKYIAFEVTGDSMDDNSRESIIEGDTLICREIQRHHWVNKLHLHRWKNFVVVHKTEGILVKRVLEHDTNTGRLLLHSLNPLFDDQEVFMDDLIALFNVIDIHRSL